MNKHKRKIVIISFIVICLLIIYNIFFYKLYEEVTYYDPNSGKIEVIYKKFNNIAIFEVKKLPTPCSKIYKELHINEYFGPRYLVKSKYYSLLFPDGYVDYFDREFFISLKIVNSITDLLGENKLNHLKTDIVNLVAQMMNDGNSYAFHQLLLLLQELVFYQEINTTTQKSPSNTR